MRNEGKKMRNQIMRNPHNNHIETKQHWKYRFKDRVMSLPISKEEVKNIMFKIHDTQRVSRGEESVCIHKFQKEIIQQDHKPHRRNEDELWLVLRDGEICTLHRRSSQHTYCTSPQGMKVDRVRYLYN